MTAADQAEIERGLAAAVANGRHRRPLLPTDVCDQCQHSRAAHTACEAWPAFVECPNTNGEIAHPVSNFDPVEFATPAAVPALNYRTDDVCRVCGHPRGQHVYVGTDSDLMWCPKYDDKPRPITTPDDFTPKPAEPAPAFELKPDPRCPEPDPVFVPIELTAKTIPAAWMTPELAADAGLGDPPHDWNVGRPSIAEQEFASNFNIQVANRVAADLDSAALRAVVGPDPSADRKATPLFSGCLNYFPDALLMVSRLSKLGNDKHNPGQPLHWAKGKSADHADCLARHLLAHGTIDPDTGFSHTVAVAWRALALLQTELEGGR